jgi:formylglycine-generating enzyme required for sulfatase activity/tRNA A-37 threonylcarbamoyl transferase component Bud32
MLNQQLKDYKILSLLGEGGMAKVYLANDAKFDTNVAIKLLNIEYTHNENIRKRFLAEAKSMFRMSHPNIIKVTDLIDDNETVAFVMEYVKGETLKEYIDRKRKLTDDDITLVFSQMLDAVGYVHSQHLVHRDIKPSNFMVSPSGGVKLMDFGIAKNTDENSFEYTQTGTGMQMGTPMYMSPEQIRNTKEVTQSSDIYSLGIVLWQMVTGTKPYDTKTLSSFDLQTKIVTENLPETNTIWDSIISKATSKATDTRFNTISSFKEHLNFKDNHMFKNSLNDTDSDKTVIEIPIQNTSQNKKPESEKESYVIKKQTNETKTHIEKEKKYSKLLIYISLVLVLIIVIGYFSVPLTKTSNDSESVVGEDISEADQSNNQEQNPAGIDWVEIKGGSFMMGSEGSESGRRSDEVSHQVSMNDFKISKYEITIEQFSNFVNATNYETDAERTGFSNVLIGYNAFEKTSGINWRHNEFGQLISSADYKRYPVKHVSWNDAKAFADWALCRLPTEAEWEYVAKSGGNSPFSTGNCLDSDQANIDGNIQMSGCYSGEYRGYVLPVGSFSSNSFGVFDMHGNLWEWCNDWYGEYDTYQSSNPSGPQSGNKRVIRGGSLDNSIDYCRSASRNKFPPTIHGYSTGIRVVK